MFESGAEAQFSLTGAEPVQIQTPELKIQVGRNEIEKLDQIRHTQHG
jgi:hypothetical protein